MDASIIYNVHGQEAFGIYIAAYFYLTGLSAGSFILSTLAYGFGFERFKPLGRIGVVLATGLLIIAPLFLLIHVGQPFRSWRLFTNFNFYSPITWGSFLLTLYPVNCLIYGFFMFKGRAKPTRIFGLIGIPLAIMVHGYTGFILSFGKARALWNSPIMPILFLTSAMVSGIALMILVCIIKDRFFSPSKTVNRSLVFDLSRILGWAIVFDLFVVFCDLSTHLISHKDSFEAVMLLLNGRFSFFFLGVETFLGKLLPLAVIFTPKTRTVACLCIISILVLIGIFTMRCNVVLGGEGLPLF